MKIPAWAPRALIALLCALPLAAAAQTSDLVSRSAFRVCADPANWPMSNDAGAGYENRLAALFADKLDLPVQYVWFPQATGFIRRTLAAYQCDVVMGYAQGHELVLNTNHYMTSAYTLVTKAGSALSGVTELADPALKGRRLGVVAGTPPGDHLARHGLIADARPYQLFTDRRRDNPIGDMLDDLDAGEIDGALIWGPLAGPMAKARGGFTVTPLIRETHAPRLVFRTTMGVRRGEKVWARKLNSLIRRNQAEIDAILREAGVPLLNAMGDALLEPKP